jgi:hypothetical protein
LPVVSTEGLTEADTADLRERVRTMIAAELELMRADATLT